MTTPADELLLTHIAAGRGHVLASVEGLDEAQLTSPTASGWSIAELLNHLTYDVEIFWGSAVVGADPEGIALVQDGWAVPVISGAECIERYRTWSRRAGEAVERTDLDAPPGWWPPEEVFPFPAFADARRAAYRMLVETATHAGHLDIVREAIDAHRHLVVR